MKSIDHRREVALRNAEKRAQRMDAARALGRHTREEWEALKARFSIDDLTLCVICGTLRPHVDKDHIVPVYQGGSDGIDNLQPACPWCNSSKGPDSTNWAAVRLTYEALL